MNTGMGLENLELGNISDYEENVIKHANEAFFLHVENKWEEAREHLRVSTEARYKYHLGIYAQLLYHDYFIDKKSCTDANLFHLVDLILMGSIRGDEHSEGCLSEYMEESMDMLQKKMILIPTFVIYNWLWGSYETRNSYPEEIQHVISVYVQKLKECWQRKNNKKRRLMDEIPSNLDEQTYMEEVEKVMKKYKCEVNEGEKKAMERCISERTTEIKTYVVEKISKQMFYL